MTPKEFIEDIYKELNRSLDSYKEIYLTTEITGKSKLYCKGAIPFFRRLKKEEQEIFFEVIRQVEIDNTASLLALIDGVYYLENQEADLKLIYEGNPEENIISGDLSDLFLELVEIEETENNT